jgi:TonB family protein
VLIGAGVGALAILGVAGWLLLGRQGAEPPLAPPPETAAAPAPAAAEPAPAAAEPAAPAGMTPEQIQALIDQALSQQKKSLEAGLKAQTEEQIKALQQQLADAQKSRAAAPAPAAPAPARIEALGESSSSSRAQLATQNLQTAPAAPAPKVEEPKAAAVPPAATTTTARPPAPAPAQPAPAAAAPADAGAVRPGELVTAGPGVTPPRVARAASLAYPALAKRMKREATVTVRVLVDENGRPAEVQPTGAKAGFGLDEAAVQYARGCQYEPARKNGVKVRMWYDLKVSFTLGS